MKRNLTNRNQLLVVTFSLFLMQALQLALRKQNWVLDVEWTISNYLASMVLYGPLVAALAAWTGARDAKSAWLSRINLYRTPIVRCISFSAIAVSTFLSILLVIVAVVPSWEGQSITGAELRGIGISCMAIAGYSFFGWAWGYRHSTNWTWSLAAVISFVATMLLWINGFESIIRFDLGMAGPYLVSYNPVAETLRLATWMLVITLSILYAVNLRLDAITKVVGMCLAVSLVLLLGTSLHTKTFLPRSEEWLCHKGNVKVCVLKQNRRFLDEIASTVAKSAIAAQLASSGRVSNTLKIDVIQPEVLDSSHTDRELLSKYLEMVWPLCQPQQFDLFSLPAKQFDQVTQIHGWISSSVEPDYRQQADLNTTLPNFPIGSPEALSELQRRLRELPSC